MSSAWIRPDLFAICVFGVGGFLLGLLGLLSARQPVRAWPPRLLGTIGCGFALFALAALAARQPISIWLPPACLAAAWFVFWLASPGKPGKLRQRLLARVSDPRSQWAAVLFAGPAAAFVLAGQLPQKSASTGGACDGLPQPHVQMDQLRLLPFHAQTDRGRAIRLYSLPENAYDPANVVALDQALLQTQAASGGIIRMAGPDPRYNCHGWVFTGGRFWLRDDEDIEKILEDNGYQEVKEPHVDDLVLYRDPNGLWGHSGIVRGVSPEGTALISSKWGVAGRYIHPQRGTSAGKQFVYFRSERLGHLLRGLEDDMCPHSPQSSAAH